MPVNVIAGCMAIGRAPMPVAGASTARPWRPEVWQTTWPSRIAPAPTSVVTTLLSMSSGTVSSSRSHARATSVGLACRTPGSIVSMRWSEAAESPAAATTSWPAARSAAESTAPTRPAPTTPIRAIRRHPFRSSPEGGYRTTHDFVQHQRTAGARGVNGPGGGLRHSRVTRRTSSATRDTGATADRVGELLESPDLSALIGAAARKLARKSQNRLVQDWHDILDSVVDSDRRTRSGRGATHGLREGRGVPALVARPVHRLEAIRVSPSWRSTPLRVEGGRYGHPATHGSGRREFSNHPHTAS